MESFVRTSPQWTPRCLLSRRAWRSIFQAGRLLSTLPSPLLLNVFPFYKLRVLRKSDGTFARSFDWKSFRFDEQNFYRFFTGPWIILRSNFFVLSLCSVLFHTCYTSLEKFSFEREAIAFRRHSVNARRFEEEFFLLVLRVKTIIRKYSIRASFRCRFIDTLNSWEVIKTVINSRGLILEAIKLATRAMSTLWAV